MCLTCDFKKKGGGGSKRIKPEEKNFHREACMDRISPATNFKAASILLTFYKIQLCVKQGCEGYTDRLTAQFSKVLKP